MNTTARVFSLVQEGIRNFERPLFADQLGMQETEHFMDTESVEQDDVPPPFFDRLGMQERKHFTDTNSTSMKKNFVRRGVQDLERPPLLDVKGEAMDVSTARTLHPEISSPFDFLEFSICDAILQNLRQRSNQFLVEDSRLRGD